MDAVCETGIFTKQEIISINRTRHYKGVHSIGDMTYTAMGCQWISPCTRGGAEQVIETFPFSTQQAPIITRG